MTEPYSRTRTSLESIEPAASSVTVYCNGSSTEGTTKRGLMTGVDKITTDVVTPNFHELKRKGKIINNPFHSVSTEHGFSSPGFTSIRTGSCSGTTVKSATTSGAVFYGGSTVWPSGNIQNSHDFYGHSPLKSDAYLTEMESLSGQVQTRCLGNIVPADVEGLVFLAEFNKTVRLLKNPLGSIRKYLDEVKRSRRYKRSSAPSLGKYLADEWLRYRYGLTPLVMDFEGALQASIAPRFGMRVTARSSGSTTGDYSNSFSVYNGGLWWKTVRATTTGTIKGSVRAGVLYEHTFNVNNSYGLGLENIPAAIWEVIPYSFIVDWFVNAGDWIKAVTPKADVNVLAEWTTTEEVQQTEVVMEYTTKTVSGYTQSGNPDGNSTRVVTEKRRTPSVSASLTSKLPSINFEAPKDWIHLGDAVALIASSLKYR